MTDSVSPPEAAWRKSSYSDGERACVEAARLSLGGVAVRHSREPAGPVLAFTDDEWDAFVAGVRSGEFDRDQLGVAF